MEYYRVETYDFSSSSTIGGVVSALNAIIDARLGIRPDCSIEERTKAYNNTNDSEIKNLIVSQLLICDIPIPDIYAENRDTMICLYKKEEFFEELYEFKFISEVIALDSEGKIGLVYKVIDIPESEILYEDNYQIVVSKDTYTKNDFGIVNLLDDIEPDENDD